jgi:ABC-type amino acid transport substrate-binding protein
MRRVCSLAVVVLGALLAGTASAEAPVLRIGISSDNPPWSFVPERLPVLLAGQSNLPPVTPGQFKTLTGLDVDVARALAQQMGMSASLVPASWLNLEKELLAGKFDVILSSWTPSRKTPPEVVVSESYYSWGLVIAVRKGSKVKSLSDLPTAGTVGHYADPAVEQTLRSLGTAHTKSYNSEGLLFRDLREGAIEAVVHDSTYARWRVNAEPTLAIVGEPLNKLGYHVGVRRQDQELTAKVLAAVKSLASSPEMAKIKAKWDAFGKPQGRPPS